MNDSGSYAAQSKVRLRHDGRKSNGCHRKTDWGPADAASAFFNDSVPDIEKKQPEETRSCIKDSFSASSESFVECLASARQSSNEELCEGDLFKIDIRVQGVPQNAVLEDQGRATKIQDLVHTEHNPEQNLSLLT